MDAADGGIPEREWSIFCLDGGSILPGPGGFCEWPAFSCGRGVFNLGELSGPNLMGNLLFSSIGFVAFIYGKRLSLWKPMFGGLALMVMPYFIADTAMMFGAGVLGTGALFFLRE